VDLRPFQLEAFQKLRHSIATGHRRPLLQSATASGKTVIASHIIRSATEKGHRTLFVVDNLELVEQAIETFERNYMKVGVMQGMHEKTDTLHKVQVCTAQTLTARIKNKPKLWGPENYRVGLIIHDEAHVQYKVRDQLAELYPDVVTIGLSATPFAKGLGKFYDDLIIAKPIQELIDEEYLVPFRVFAPSEPDLKGVSMNSKGDYKDDEAAKKYTQTLIADIADTWLKRAKGRPTIGFACNVAHSKEMAKEFVSRGINAVHIDGYGGNQDAKEYRQSVVQKFKAGEIDVLWNVGIATKGFDAPIASCIIDAGPTKSLTKHVQKFGRGLRTYYGKEDCIVLDHSGNCARNGFPTDINISTLDDGKKGIVNSLDRRKKEAALPKVCSGCSYVKPPGVHQCPSCGFAPEKRSKVKMVDGELVEIKPLKKKKHDRKDMIRWYSEFLFYAENKGFSKGWAYHKFRSKFGQDPPRKGIYQAKGISADVKGYIQMKNIAYAKMKEKEKNNATA